MLLIQVKVVPSEEGFDLFQEVPSAGQFTLTVLAKLWHGPLSMAILCNVNLLLYARDITELVQAPHNIPHLGLSGSILVG